MEIYRALNHIGRVSLDTFAENRIPLQQDVLEQVVLVRLGLNTAYISAAEMRVGIKPSKEILIHALGNDLTSYRATLMEISVPQLD